MLRWIYLLTFLTFIALADTTRVGDNSALVIIDMQEVFATRGGHAADPANVAILQTIQQRQLELIRMARRQHLPIVFIEYEGQGPTNSPLKEAVRGYSRTRTFLKSTDGMLDTDNSHLAELSGYLQENQIGNLIITGANGGACVQMSIDGALRNNYNVIAVETAIADFNFEAFVYPYTGQYTEFTHPTCESCSFREITDIPTLSLLLTQRQTSSDGRAINDSDRSVPRRDTPVRSRPAGARETTTSRQ